MVRRSGNAIDRRNDWWARLEPYLRKGPLAEDAFSERLHDQRTASILGIALGVAFGVSFLTGWFSHLLQHPAPWFPSFTRPAGFYRFTQGLHVATGIASIPLLLTKLWVVYPRFWTWPPVRSLTHGVERLLLLPLVGGALMLLATGVANITGWYPWPFFFIQGHYAAAWITIGALIVHAASKLPVVRRALQHGEDRLADVRDHEGLTRRGVLGAAFGTAGLLTLVTAGQSFRPLNPFNLLAPRDQDVGSQGLPINRTAARARVTRDLAASPDYRLIVDGAVVTPVSLTYEELAAMPLTEVELPIACVEGWSHSAVWRGVPIRDLLALAGASPDSRVQLSSLEERGPYRRSTLEPAYAADPATMLALEVNGEVLNLDHGFPCRLMAPNRPGALQTKWVTRLEVVA